MRDGDFEDFVSDFGEATTRIQASSSDIEKWRGRLPDRLLSWWSEEGWSGYADGLFWLVNPSDYEDIVEEWLGDTELGGQDKFHVVARTAFGVLYASGESMGCDVVISCPRNSIFAGKFKTNSKEQLDVDIRSFLAVGDKEKYDFKDRWRVPLFDRALKSLGSLASDEMYGFEPALVLGGERKLENLRKVKLDQHLTILRQFGDPDFPFKNIDFDAIIKSHQ